MGIIDDKAWQAQQDMRVLREAEEIKADAKRSAAAKSIAQKHLKQLSEVVAKKPATRTRSRSK